MVGTNGKSSTTRMIAAILAATDCGSALTSRPIWSPSESGSGSAIATCDEAAFGAAVGARAHAAGLVDRIARSDGDGVTQFEALTAAAFTELARCEVEVAVIEAGLGGRYDATNVIPSKVQVLTSIGLEHTRWLGPTLADIAPEKLDVVQPGGRLVLGEGLHPDVLAVARRVCEQRGAQIVQAGSDPGVAVGAAGAHQRRNFALARAAAQAYLGELEMSRRSPPRRPRFASPAACSRSTSSR